MATRYVEDYEEVTGLKIPSEVEAKVVTAPKTPKATKTTVAEVK